ncbi:MAG: hypothetical protein LBS21_16180 [Clostridiales bacterium]|jgi:hypothetical protein|nr:hypothetical protein [Clostridiales bacterium]
MAFTMTHLIISENIYKTFSNSIESLPKFYLGSIAPDAAHQRADYTSEFKKASHLITSDEQWGMITKTDEWKENVIEFLVKNKKGENHDFIVGYCTHLLGDIYNTIYMWNPFKLKYANELKEISYGNINHQECNKIDIELALTYDGRKWFWFYLSRAKSVDLPGIIYAEEIDKQRDLILNSWYEGKERQDLSSNKVRTYENELNFIKTATNLIESDFREYLS